MRTADVLYEETLRASPRAWLWLVVISVVTFFTIGPIAVPIAVAAWIVNVARFSRTRVRIDRDRIWLGRRSLPLAALDLGTVDRATNPWPWRYFSSRYLGANPIWTRDSLRITGRDDGRRCWVSVGTNHRDDLLGVLQRAVPDARARASAAAAAYAGLPLPPSGWYEDPWAPATTLRWWDGSQWTGYTAPRPGGPS